MGSSGPVRGPVVLLGTSEFAVPSLEALVEAGERVALVVTQPDRPRGRGRRLEPSPVKRAADQLGLSTYQPERINAPEALAALEPLSPEFVVVVAYGQLLKSPLLAVPARGVVNLHPSILPRHRGPSPVAWTILAGDRRYGVSTMFLDEGLDSGPVILQESFPLDSQATRGDLEVHLSDVGARLLVRTLRQVREGSVESTPQDPAQATLSRLLTRDMRRVDWIRPADELRRLVHALSPSPAAVARVGSRLLKILRVREIDRGGEPGRVLEATTEGPVVGCGCRALVLLEVQPEGKRAMSGADLARGGGIKPGDVLDDPWQDAS